MRRLITLLLLCSLSVVGIAQTSHNQFGENSKQTTNSENSVKRTTGKANTRYTTVSGEVRHHRGRRAVQGVVPTNHPICHNSVSGQPSKYSVYDEAEVLSQFEGITNNNAANTAATDKKEMSVGAAIATGLGTTALIFLILWLPVIMLS